MGQRRIAVLCKDVMSKNVRTSPKDGTASSCAKIMEKENVGLLPVVNARGKVIGVVTDRDLALRVLAAGKAAKTPIGSVMTSALVTCGPEEDLHVAEDRMCKAKKSRILVLDEDGKCAGVISLSDIGRVEERPRAGQVLGSVAKREASP